jgi:hypothetical protein
MWTAIQNGGRKFALLCSRRLGKSYVLVLYSIMHAIKTPNARVSYAAPFGRDAAEIATDLMSEILQDCPEDLRPEYRVATKEYIWKHNNASIRFAGLNAEHANQLRGRKATLFVIDELALVDDVAHCISDVALPMTLTTGGRLLFATTPARSPGHESSQLLRKMVVEGNVVTFTLLDNVRVSDEIKAEYLLEAGEEAANIPDILAGKRDPESTTALREYFCRFVTDSETAVIPEFTAAAQAEIVKEHEVPPYAHRFVSMDPGFQDRTGILFAYYDYHAQKLVIEDEAILTRASTDDIAFAIKNREEALWGARTPLLRVTDIDLRLIEDLSRAHALIFTQANRQDSMGAIDLVRNMVRRREIIINPRCISLIRQMRNAVWTRNGKDFERTPEDGHQDALAALKYLCRHVIRTNPFPSWWGANGFNTNYPGGHGPAGAAKRPSLFSDTPLGRRLKKKWG